VGDPAAAADTQLPQRGLSPGQVTGTAATAATAHAAQHAPAQLTLVSQLTAIQFFTASGPISGFPATPLVPGDRIIGQDRILQDGRPAGHDNEACTVSFGRDVLCQDIIILTGQGDLQASWTLQWPAAGAQGPASFDGVIDGGTAHFAASHGTFHAATLPDGDMQITAVIGAGRQ
jgi:hypothetical protein